MPANTNNSDLPNSAEYTREISYDQSKLLQNIAQDEPRLNIDQKKVFTTLLSSIDNNEGKIFFLDAPGGTGKTFLIHLLLIKVRSTGKIALAVASSGIAATLLEGGRTAHSIQAFKLPLKIATDDNNSVCSVSKQSNTGKLIRHCSLIVWDEATMSNKTSVEGLDRTMRDLRSKNAPMGGCTILFSGDFRQIPPVVTRGTRADDINASLKRSNLWPHVNKLELKTNMRLSLSSRENRLFSEMLLKVNNGKLTQSDGRINLENLCVLIDNIQDLVNNVYPDIHNISCKTISWFKERAILSPTNEQVDKVNNLILAKIDTPTQIYYSVDTVLDSEEAVHFPTEFLNSLNPSGLPPHKMELKVGCPVILLRNLNPPKLCNGTRLLIYRSNLNAYNFRWRLKTLASAFPRFSKCPPGVDRLLEAEYPLRPQVTARGCRIFKSHKATEEMCKVYRMMYEKNVRALVCCVDDGTEEIAGCNMLYIDEGKDNIAEIIKQVETPEILTLFRIIKVADKYYKISHGTDNKVLLNGAGLYVNPKFRGCGIATQILKARECLCKELQISETGAWFTGLGSQKAAQKAGYEVMSEVSYEELGEKTEVVFVDVPEYCKFMVLRVDT
ncbi:ATP-dependent DNA helicase PIF1 [Eumeta japonica]|uniref:ATP-dependent DNA helicase n=1 Tax=Eumeta variegata TaxID=151549 RepID=A0A4C1XR67_EUMVA|nr:ATP-dependent DNA helicase PIF1 [Eumeta japonica]